MKRSFFFLALVVLLLPSCSLYKQVEVQQILDVQVLSFDENGADCEIYMTINNPNSYKITLTDSQVDLFFEGSPLGKVVLTENLVLPKKSVTTLKLKCLADYESLQSIFSNALALLFKTDYVMEGKGYVKGKALLVSKKVPVNFKEKLSRSDLGF